MGRGTKSIRHNWEGDKAGFPRDKDGWTTYPTDPAEQLLADQERKKKKKAAK